VKRHFLARQGWTIWHPAVALALAAIGVFLTRAAWDDIRKIAMVDEEQSHIFLVPLVAAWMIWVRRFRLRNCAPAGTIVGPIVVAAGWLCSFVGYTDAIQSVWHLGAVLVAVGCLLSVLGVNVLFRFMPAFAVLVFLVPMPNAIRQMISIPLQTATAATTQVILETLGVAIERNGNVLSINNIEVAVAEACNGMRMVFALVLVSYAFAFGMPLRNFMRVIVLVASPFAAILCNVLRLIPTILLFGYSSSEVATAFHDISGWLMLPIAFGILLGVVRTLSWALIPVNRFTLAYQ